MQHLTISIAQKNFWVGDIAGNSQKIIQEIQQIPKAPKTDLVVFPELSLCGYPPEDLLLRSDFRRQIGEHLELIEKSSENIALIVGHPHYENEKIYNAATLFHNRKKVATYFKQCLPNYKVFDEKRYFTAGNKTFIFNLNGVSIALLICEDIWFAGPSQQAKKEGAELIICINASPFSFSKNEEREDIIKKRIDETGLPFIYAHGVGGEDDLVFDGGSMVFSAQKNKIAQAEFFKETLFTITLSKKDKLTLPPQLISPMVSKESRIYQALSLGLHDYIIKNQIPGVLLGLSGGVDSALVCAIAVDTLGADRVRTVFLPSQFTSSLSANIAKTLAQNLQVTLQYFSIEDVVESYVQSFSQEKYSLTSLSIENIQARCRAIFLMALSNQTGYLLLNTTNKSELAMGYGTLYGDLAGSFALLKDIYKTNVYELANFRNNLSSIFPDNVITRAPTAELSPGQVDSDSLPPYPLLDSILKLYIEGEKTCEEIIKLGFEEKTVKKVIQTVNKQEFKRRQIAIGPKISSQAFGRERRFPITSGFKNT